jgi:hypothetical protein
MLEAFALVPLVGNQGLGMAALSYLDQLNLGVLTDATVCPDVDAFCDGMNEAFRRFARGIEPTAAGRTVERLV